MVEVVLRFEIDDDRRKSMLLQDRRRAQGALETMDLFARTTPRNVWRVSPCSS